MGTLYDLLGALPSDDAEGLRTAFRKAAKATHPDINPDNPDAALRFRELVRAYDILNDVEQRTTYDQLLTIALQPPPATKAVRTYEVIGKVASNTMAATVISAVLVGGYVLFGIFSKPPGAAEITSDSTIGETQLVAALHPDVTASDEPRIQREGDASTAGAVVTSEVAPAAKEANAAPSAVSNRSRHSSHTIWRFNIIRASQPPISTAASFCIASAISTRAPRSLHPNPRRTRGEQRPPRLPRASRCRYCLLLRPLRRQTGECRSPRP